MRTVKKNFIDRLNAQTKEAKTQGLTKLAARLNNIIHNEQTREDNSFYLYSNAEFKKDIKDLFWKAAIRSADFYNYNIDAIKVNSLIDDLATEFVRDMRVLGGNINGVGAYEPSVLGEAKETTVLEIEEED